MLTKASIFTPDGVVPYDCMSLVGILARSGRSIYNLLGNRRACERQPITGTIRVTYRTTLVVVAHDCPLVDISTRGFGIQYPEPIAPDAVVQLTSEEGGIARLARVCYCEPSGAVFRVGLELMAEPQKIDPMGV